MGKWNISKCSRFANIVVQFLTPAEIDTALKNVKMVVKKKLTTGEELTFSPKKNASRIYCFIEGCSFSTTYKGNLTRHLREFEKHKPHEVAEWIANNVDSKYVGQARRLLIAQRLQFSTLFGAILSHKPPYPNYKYILISI